MTLDERREAVRSWREARCAEACPTCPENCCEGRLTPRIDRMEAFAHLPLVRRPTDVRPLGEAYIIDRRVWRWGSCFLVGRCPALDGERRCGLHGQNERPSECSEFPLHVQPVLGGAVLHIERSCTIFDDEAAVAEARALAAQLGLGVVVNPRTR